VEGGRWVDNLTFAICDDGSKGNKGIKTRNLNSEKRNKNIEHPKIELFNYSTM